MSFAYGKESVSYHFIYVCKCVYNEIPNHQFLYHQLILMKLHFSYFAHNFVFTLVTYFLVLIFYINSLNLNISFLYQMNINVILKYCNFQNKSRISANEALENNDAKKSKIAQKCCTVLTCAWHSFEHHNKKISTYITIFGISV